MKFGSTLMSVKDRLSSMGIRLLSSNGPVSTFTYIPYRKIGKMVYISGQLPKTQLSTGEIDIVKGKVGDEISVEAAKLAARACGVSLLSVLRDACDGDLDRVTAVLKIDGFVSCVDSFVDHPLVINGCSDLFVEVFGAQVGSHARAAVGCSSLPLGVPVEIAGIFEISL